MVCVASNEAQPLSEQKGSRTMDHWLGKGTNWTQEEMKTNFLATTTTSSETPKAVKINPRLEAMAAQSWRWKLWQLR